MNSPKSNEILIASDHAGFTLKEFLKSNLTDIEWIDYGTQSAERCDYPDFARKAASEISNGKKNRAILVCGSGIGMSIVANKFKGVRAAVVESEQTAMLSRAHNDANVLCLGQRIVSEQLALKIVRLWLTTPFEGGRHCDRIAKISKLEEDPT